MIKKIIAWLHLWLGLITGIIVIVLSITGCVLVFEQEIKNLSSPWLHVEKPDDGVVLPPSELYRAVEKVIPNRKLNSIWYHGAERTASFNTNSDSLIYVNPYTAEVVAIVDDEDFFHFIEEGHFHLWLPEEIGEPIVGWSMVTLFVLLITGIVLWWPKKWNKSGKKKAFRIKWKAKFKRVNYDLHNVLGFYSLIIVLLMVITALIMCFSWFSKGVYWVSGGGPLPEYAVAASDTTYLDTADYKQRTAFSQVDKAWHMGINEIGEYNPEQIIVSFPSKMTDAIYLCTDMHGGSWRNVYVDQFSLEILPSSQSKMRDEQFAVWLRRSNFTLHVGAFGGLTTKIIYFFASLICASLPITGFYIWYGKKKKIAKKKKI